MTGFAKSDEKCEWVVIGKKYIAFSYFCNLLVVECISLSSTKKHSRKNTLPIKYLPSVFLLSVTLGKGVVECKKTFVECLGHSTNNTSLVVNSVPHTR